VNCPYLLAMNSSSDKIDVPIMPYLGEWIGE